MKKFRRWLKGSFTCKKCGKEFFTMCFGFGEAICPDCYSGEEPFLFFDNRYWLNRITSRLLNNRVSQRKSSSIDPLLLHQTSTAPAIEITE